MVHYQENYGKKRLEVASYWWYFEIFNVRNLNKYDKTNRISTVPQCAHMHTFTQKIIDNNMLSYM